MTSASETKDPPASDEDANATSAVDSAGAVCYFTALTLSRVWNSRPERSCPLRRRVWFHGPDVEQQALALRGAVIFHSDQTVTERSSPAMSPSRRTRGTEPAHNADSGARSYTRSCVTGGRPRQGIPAVAAPWPHRTVSLGPPCVIGQVDLEKRCDVAP